MGYDGEVLAADLEVVVSIVISAPRTGRGVVRGKGDDSLAGLSRVEQVASLADSTCKMRGKSDDSLAGLNRAEQVASLADSTRSFSNDIRITVYMTKLGGWQSV